MKRTSYFKTLVPLSKAAQRTTPEWMTPRALDLLDLLEAADRPLRVVRDVIDFTFRDIQAARTLLAARDKGDPESAKRCKALVEVLTAAYTWKQVPKLLRSLDRLTQQAAAEIQEDPTVRYGWRGPRPSSYLILIAKNDRMTIKARLASLVELRPADFPEAIEWSEAVLRRTVLSTRWAALHVDRKHTRGLLLAAQQLQAGKLGSSR